MADNIRELDQIQTELDRLHERSQGNKATITAHEAVCEERYAQIITTMTTMHEELQSLHKKIDDVSELATQGRTSLKTLLWVGGVGAGIITLLTMIINVFPR
jgi:phage host-nuclease inhibitor protein Gam